MHGACLCKAPLCVYCQVGPKKGTLKSLIGTLLFLLPPTCLLHITSILPNDEIVRKVGKGGGHDCELSREKACRLKGEQLVQDFFSEVALGDEYCQTSDEAHGTCGTALSHVLCPAKCQDHVNTNELRVTIQLPQ